MARFNLGKNTSRRTPNGSPNYDWVESRINEIVDYRSFDHYELDPAEVTSVIITSDKCYDNLELERGYNEKDLLGGKDIYSGSKGAAELIIKSFYNSFF